jgi:predicted metal-dependent enzyme (double-stranded beta helix superfamily)
VGDIHQVTNAFTDCGSLSIHVYGGNIGAVRRYTFDPATGKESLFVSGYTNKVVPNLWDRSSEVRAAG